ncbi:beta-glucosidase [Aquabacter sp. CN5-332]|uniref:beta-glucosidase n=1 Tax=Aquabacter sp. CN5-332 TaxID=3156608 RepID=UPI0032B3EC3C
MDFASYFMGGFECSTHRKLDGTQLDMLCATHHDALAERDYRQLRALGMSTIRDGVRWHLIEREPGIYDWSSFLPMLQAAARAEVQVIWDLCHYGWPSSIDIWSAEFVRRFGAFARELARLVQSETKEPPWFCPVNEMSFWSWAGGEVAHMAPAGVLRGRELKRQLVRASLAARAEILSVIPTARFLHAEPLIHVAGGTETEADMAEAEAFRLSQYEACDMLDGRLEPELGGHPDVLDVVGVNFYPHNEWAIGTGAIPLGNHGYRALSDMLAEVYWRYGKSLVIAETGAEGGARAAWLHYVCDEVAIASRVGVPILGICLYPITAYPGWENGRSCPVGILGAVDSQGYRPIYTPLAQELRRQQGAMRLSTASEPDASSNW